jgi:phospholipase/carboxylesterase
MDQLYTAHVPPGEGPHPAVVLLHGWGASAHDLLGLAPILHRGEALVLCPQGPLAFQAGPSAVGYGWFPLSQGRPPDLASIEEARAALEEFLDEALERYPIDPERLVLGGFSQGGFMAYQIALRRPERFAGLLAMSSWLPAELAEDIPSSPAHAQLPTLVIHGSDDPRPEALREILVWLEEKVLSPVLIA